ncbi:unnamed protein product, partial [Cylicocyclus nassatus]
MCFSKQSSFVLIALIWIISIGQHIVVEGIFGCTLYYADINWGFNFKLDGLCLPLVNYSNTTKQYVMAGLVGSADAITMVKLRLSAKMLSGDSKQAKAKRKADVNFFKQSLAQFLIWVLEMTSYFFISGYFPGNKIVLWILQNWAWLLMHTADGISLLAINQELKKLFRNPTA